MDRLEITFEDHNGLQCLRCVRWRGNMVVEVREWPNPREATGRGALSIPTWVKQMLSEQARRAQ